MSPDGICDELRAALAAAPEDERALLELRLTWPGLDDARARIAARLRVFLVTWDPLGWHDRPPGRATATGDGDGCEVVLYLPLHEILAAARESGERVAVVLGRFGASVVSVGARFEQALVAGIYPQLAFSGAAPSLLAEVGQLSGLATPTVAVVSAGWEPIGLGAIGDLVQEAFGPVDLDRAPVRLAAVEGPVAGCPACEARSFGFPAELMDAQPAMCGAHAERAQAVADERMARGWESNRDGMDAILGTSSLLGEPTFGLSLQLLRRLDDIARRDPAIRLSSAELARDGELALCVAERVTGRPERLTGLMEYEYLSPDWLIELPMALASAGLVGEAVAVGDAFAQLDTVDAAAFARDVALILAQAGRADQALQRVEANAGRHPDDPWTHINAGDVHAALGDAQRAERGLRRALAIAQRHGSDADGDAAYALQRLAELLAGQPGREDEAADVARDAQRVEDAAYGGPRFAAVTAGRNDPCPCGSGRKYKRCCGA